MSANDQADGKTKMSIQIATDGSCIVPPGFAKGDDTPRPGASGFVARMADGTFVGKAVPSHNGTIGLMEIKGLRMGLEFAAAIADRTQERITIKCDSQFVVNGFNEWLDGWAAKGYHKKGGLAGAEDWRAIDAIKQSMGDRIAVQWVRGHNGDPLNERVDGIVNESARSQKPYDTTATVLSSQTSAEHAPAVTDRFSGIPSAVADRSSIVARADEAREFGDALGRAERANPTGKGLYAQAADLLTKAAADPRMARLLAHGIELALEQSRVATRHDRETVDQATFLKAVLEQRGEER
jgi:ribonuclease HI